MKRLPIIVLTLALCLLTAGCGAKPNEPDDGDFAKAGIVGADGDCYGRGDQICPIVRGS